MIFQFNFFNSLLHSSYSNTILLLIFFSSQPGKQICLMKPPSYLEKAADTEKAACGLNRKLLGLMLKISTFQKYVDV